MCEWLSYGDWCDVTLVCGGRAFSAHRAVLASVSNFLRRLLLSCSTDESPTFIVLPDFDLDAMSSVLYYIYNGEVTVQREKIEMFLDIIRAMQIFIDSQYLPQMTEKLKSDLRLHTEADVTTKRHSFALGLGDSRDQRYINLKKPNEIQNKLLQYSVSNSDCEDKLVRSLNPSGGEPKPSLGDLKSPYGDRQRNFFLRDLFIERYPRNGNVNGLTAGVLAISNECYRAPTSVLLTNANGKHLKDNDALLETFKKASEPITHSDTVFHLHKKQPQKTDTDEQDNSGITKSYCATSCIDVYSAEKINKQFHGTRFQSRPKNIWMNHVPTSSPNPLLQFGLQEQVLSRFYVPSLDFRVPTSILDPVKSLQAFNSTAVDNALLEENSNTSKHIDTNPASRVTILNHVLESPWSPRIPNNYKPFRRKIVHGTWNMSSQMADQKKIEETIQNDSNNNIEKSNIAIKLDAVEETIAVSDNKEVLELSSLPLGKRDEFKCTVCNQIFTSNEFLTAHMRRHSINARYTCGECSKTFSQLRNFKYHMSIHKGTREFAATCTVCGKYFNDRGYLSSHMKIHRNRKEYKCTLCPKSFNQRVAYNMHVRIHTGVKPHVCEECGKAFSRKMLLKQHQRTHSGERPYACTLCDKRFADRSNMTLHLRLHTGVKPFSCTLCPKSFTKKHHLKSHLNFHTGSKPYSCPRCKLAFTQSSNMRTHLKKCRAPEPESEHQQQA